MRLGRVQRIVVVLTLTVLAVGAGAPAPMHAQAEWLIVPGKSWGPVFIGETEGGVMSALGPPRKRNDSALASDWEYPTAYLQFFRQVAQNPSDTMKLLSIRVWEPTTVTREGVRVGTRISEVLRAYGDTGDNIKTDASADCLDLVINGDRSSSQTSYDRPTIFLTYLDRGVGFDLGWVGGSRRFIVGAVRIMNPTACRPLR